VVGRDVRLRQRLFLIRHSRGAQVKGRTMKSSYTAVVKEDAGWWIGWIEEVPGVNCQEATRQELVKSLEMTLR